MCVALLKTDSYRCLENFLVVHLTVV